MPSHARPRAKYRAYDECSVHEVSQAKTIKADESTASLHANSNTGLHKSLSRALYPRRPVPLTLIRNFTYV